LHRFYQKATAGFPGGIDESTKAARAGGLSFRLYLPIAGLAVPSSLLRADGDRSSAGTDLRGFGLNDRKWSILPITNLRPAHYQPYFLLSPGEEPGLFCPCRKVDLLEQR